MWTFNPGVDSKAVLQELRQQTDRGVAIVAASLLESVLTRAIKAHMVENAEVEQRMFRSSGPLGSFSAKIDLGYLLNILDEDERRVFIRIKDIRNDCAHSVEPQSFESQRIKGICGNFPPAIAIYDHMAGVVLPEESDVIETLRGVFQEYADAMRGDSDTPRSRFEGVVQLYLFKVSLHAAVREVERSQKLGLTQSLRD